MENIGTHCRRARRNSNEFKQSIRVLQMFGRNDCGIEIRIIVVEINFGRDRLAFLVASVVGFGDCFGEMAFAFAAQFRLAFVFAKRLRNVGFIQRVFGQRAKRLAQCEQVHEQQGGGSHFGKMSHAMNIKIKSVQSKMISM